MSNYNLDFGNITILQDNIAEVIIFEAVEMDIHMVNVYHEFLLSHLKKPFGLLINKKNAYTYTFEAQKQLASLKEICAMAVVLHGPVTEMATRTLINLHKKDNWNIQLFEKRNEALEWLIENQISSYHIIN